MKEFKRLFQWMRLGAACAALTLTARAARAQQVLGWPVGTRPPVFQPGPGPLPFPRPRPDLRPLPLEEQTVKGAVSAQIARVELAYTFRNDGDQRLEGELLLPLPADCAIDKLELRVGGKVQKAELLEADKARSTYESIVRQLRDPALLELQGERLARARVFPIEPHSQLALSISFTQILGKQGGLYALHLPLASRASSAAPASVSLSLEAPSRLRLLYSPTDPVQIRREGERRAQVDYRAASGGRDLVLLYSIEEDELAPAAASFRPAGEDGYFLLSLSPKLKDAGPALPKDLVFVLDRSGSMEEDRKIEQARKALLYCLARLSPGDRFAVVDFGSEVAGDEALKAASAEEKARARDYVGRIEASGGTNMEGALDRALSLLSGSAARERVPMLMLLTDGLPTVGNTDPDALLRQVHERNKAVRARVFCLGAGSDVNSLFLDKLAEGQRGSRDYILPGEDIELKAGSLYRRIARPALTDVKLAWSGVEVAQVYPRQVSDIYDGDPVVLLGRLAKGEKGKLELSGRAGGRRRSFELPLDFGDKSRQNDYLPRLWAQRKVAALLDEMRLGGRNAETAAEISRLAKRYGIVTPYTSFLIAEDKNVAALAPRAQAAMSAMRADAEAVGGRALAAHAFSRMMEVSRGAEALVLEAPKPAAMAAADTGSGGAFALMQPEDREALKGVEIRTVGARTFYKRGASWVDGAFEALDASAPVERLACASPRYFELLRLHPELQGVYVLGKELSFVLEGRAYRVAAP